MGSWLRRFTSAAFGHAAEDRPPYPVVDGSDIDGNIDSQSDDVHECHLEIHPKDCRDSGHTQIVTEPFIALSPIRNHETEEEDASCTVSPTIAESDGNSPCSVEQDIATYTTNVIQTSDFDEFLRYFSELAALAGTMIGRDTKYMSRPMYRGCFLVERSPKMSFTRDTFTVSSTQKMASHARKVLVL